MITITNPSGIQVSSNSYNTARSIVTNYNALNEMTVWTYNSRQQVTSVRYPSGLITTNFYGSDNFLSSTIDYSVSGTNTIYYRTNFYSYATNLVYLHIDERTRTTTNYWDNLQRLIAEVDGRGTNSYFYDKLDLVKTVDRMGHTNAFGYDLVRRKIVETNALGTVTGYAYCSCGSPSYVTNAVGTPIQRIQQFNHDYQGRLTYIYDYGDNTSVAYY